jgi:hypothetical protein
VAGLYCGFEWNWRISDFVGFLIKFALTHGMEYTERLKLLHLFTYL